MPKERLAYIDSTKGICAILVCLFHFQLQFLNAGYIGWHCQPEAAADPFTAYFSAFPYSLLVNNSFRLPLFFALIAFLPALRLFRDGDRDHILKEARVRYFSFLPLVFIACMVSYALTQCGLRDFNGFFRVTGNEWPRANEDYVFDLWGALKAGLFTAFTDGTQLVPPFWCMHYIFLGSYFVYAFLLMFGRLRRRWPFYLIAGALMLFHDPSYLSFLSGVVAADFAAHRSRMATGQGLALIAAGCLLSLFPAVLLPPSLDINTLTALGVLLILMGMHSGFQDLAFHRSPLLAWCSRQSLALIVIHNIVQFSLNILLFLRFHQAGMSYGLNVALQFLISVAATALLTLLYAWIMTPVNKKLCSLVLDLTGGAETQD